MDDVLEALRMKIRQTGPATAPDDLFDLLAAGCFLCCHDGARGGNDSCGDTKKIA